MMVKEAIEKLIGYEDDAHKVAVRSMRLVESLKEYIFDTSSDDFTSEEMCRMLLDFDLITMDEGVEKK